MIRGDKKPLIKNRALAELNGVILGDGHIWRFPRTDELSIFSNSNNQGFIKRYSGIIEAVFAKKPALTKHGSGCIRIRIYQKNIQKRLNIPYSPRSKLTLRLPRWISNNKGNVVGYLRGLYEAEGSYCVHVPTYTYKALFSNRNKSLLKIVYRLVKGLGFHPHMSRYQVQISRKQEVLKFLELIQFRKY
jgi:DNA-binding transcriptional regulator WhiA